MRWDLEMNLTQEKAESKGERLELLIKSKPNQHLELSMTRDRDSKFSMVLKPVEAWIFVTGKSCN